MGVEHVGQAVEAPGLGHANAATVSGHETRAERAAATATPPRASPSLLRPASNCARTAIASHTRWIGNGLGRNKGLSGESENPTPKRPGSIAEAPKTAAPLEETEYHGLADEYLEAVLAKFEHLQEQRPEVDVEFTREGTEA